jgi:hypothetical protein
LIDSNSADFYDRPSSEAELNQADFGDWKYNNWRPTVSSTAPSEKS